MTKTPREKDQSIIDEFVNDNIHKFAVSFTSVIMTIVVGVAIILVSLFGQYVSYLFGHNITFLDAFLASSCTTIIGLLLMSNIVQQRMYRMMQIILMSSLCSHTMLHEAIGPEEDEDHHDTGEIEKVHML